MAIAYETITANLMVSDVDESVEFYREILGFDLEMSVPDESGNKLQWAMMSREGTAVMLQSVESITEEYPQWSGREPGGTFALFVKMTGLEEYHKQVSAKTDILKDPYETFYGMREFQLRDPDGYVFTFAEELETNS